MTDDLPEVVPASAPVVSVVGEAVLRAEPDEAIVLVTLSALADTPGPALEDVARRSGSLVALLDELAVLPADRSTTGVSVQEDFDHTRQGRPRLVIAPRPRPRFASPTLSRLVDW